MRRAIFCALLVFYILAGWFIFERVMWIGMSFTEDRDLPRWAHVFGLYFPALPVLWFGSFVLFLTWLRQRLVSAGLLLIFVGGVLPTLGYFVAAGLVVKYPGNLCYDTHWTTIDIECPQGAGAL